MILDSSAIIAILNDEPEKKQFLSAISDARVTRISAATFLETAIVVDSTGNPIASQALDDFLSFAGVLIEPVTLEHARRARYAYRAFGKGGGSPAQLNFGDCFTYALADTAREPLLFKGDDFAHTDITPAV